MYHFMVYNFTLTCVSGTAGTHHVVVVTDKSLFEEIGKALSNIQNVFKDEKKQQLDIHRVLYAAVMILLSFTVAVPG